MKPVSKLSIFAIVLFAAAGVFAVSFGSVFLFRKVVDYMANPSDEAVRDMAFRDFRMFQDSFSSHRTFWISDSDLKYYSNI